MEPWTLNLGGGGNYKGMNAWAQVEDLTHRLRMNDKLNVKAYRIWFTVLQLYVHDVQDEILVQRGLWPQRFSESKLRKILSTLMSEIKKNKLLAADWHIAKQLWNKTLDQLENLELIIKWEAQEKKVLSNLIQQRQQSGGGNRNGNNSNCHKWGKGKNGGRNGNRNDNDWSGSTNDANPRSTKDSLRRKYKNCRGWYPVQYRKQLNNKFKNKTKNKTVMITNLDLFAMIKQLHQQNNDSKSDDIRKSRKKNKS